MDKKRVGYMSPSTDRGPDKTTFGYIAAERFFSERMDEIQLINFPAHEDICYAVARQQLDYGVVAAENSVQGFVTETIRAVCDAEIYGGLRVSAEILVPIELYYLRKELMDEPPKLVFSHNVALQQCSRFIRSLRAKGIDADTRRSTGEVAYEASQNPEYAALATDRAEKAYNLVRIEPRSVTDDIIAFARTYFKSKID